jgi:hypothetical protein
MKHAILTLCLICSPAFADERVKRSIGVTTLAYSTNF